LSAYGDKPLPYAIGKWGDPHEEKEGVRREESSLGSFYHPDSTGVFSTLTSPTAVNYIAVSSV
jgi:hypothetical protein